MGGKYRGDIKLMVMGIEQSLECKRRARAFASLAAWLGQNYALVIRDDRCEPMVVMSLRDWTNLIRSNGQHVAAGEEKL